MRSCGPTSDDGGIGSCGRRAAGVGVRSIIGLMIAAGARWAGVGVRSIVGLMRAAGARWAGVDVRSMVGLLARVTGASFLVGGG